MCHFTAMCVSMASSSSSRRGPGFQIVDTEPLVFGQASGHFGIKAVFLIGWRVFPVW